MDMQGTEVTSKGGGFQTAAGITAVVLSIILGLTMSRVLFEGLFPRFLWLGRPLPVLLLASLTAVIGYFFWRWLSIRLQAKEGAGDAGLSPSQAAWTAAAVYLPLAINLFYLINRQVDLVTSRYLLFTSLWLMALFLTRLLTRPGTWRWLGFSLLIVYLAVIYLQTMGQTVGLADTFEFQVVVPRLGIVHPTGYPLYLLLTKLFTYIPVNSMAWRVNLASAVYGLAAVSLLYALGWRLTGWAIASLLAAVLLGLSPTFWSQSIEAEVYTLHALLVVAALFLMREIGDWRLTGLHGFKGGERASPESDTTVNEPALTSPYSLTLLLSFVLGLGLANHLTTLILLPATGLTILFAYRAGRFRTARIKGVKSLIFVIGAFLLPLLLYGYLPIRWAAVNGEPMGFSRFLDWVVGGRFQGALRLDAWLNDLARYDIVGRLLVNEWSFDWSWLLIFVGAAYLFLWQWRYALILFLTWLGYVFYALSYYVPDLAVFLIPAQIIIAIWWLAGVVAALDLVTSGPDEKNQYKTLMIEIVFVMAGIVPLLITASDQTWIEVDRSLSDGRVQWAESVLAQPLAEHGAILADSDKFPALYYLQQAENVRPDLDIMVLPDEEAYRVELETRLADGQSVYLARYLPGLEGVYHLSSAGPLTFVGQAPVEMLPEDTNYSDISIDSIQLLAYSVEADSPYSAEESAATLYWQANESQDRVLTVYTRWAGEGYSGPVSVQHPANNSYPTVAWRVGEVVTDYHTLPRPPVNKPTTLEFQVALAPPFTELEELSWQVVDTTQFLPLTSITGQQPIRAQVGAVPVDGYALPHQVRTLTEIPVSLTGYGPNMDQLLTSLRPEGEKAITSARPIVEETPDAPRDADRSAHTTFIETDVPPGQYDVIVHFPGQQAICGWLSPSSSECLLREVVVSGVPLPDGATNFEDKVALLSVELPDTDLQPDHQLSVNLTWQALGPLAEDYTVFVQVLDDQEKIVGQVDSWPVQGTHPTSQWTPGQVVEDPYLVQLDEELAPGPYKLNIGWYLLETLRRLPVLDSEGVAVDDKTVVPGLMVAEP